jgi:signal transduction histidine kinase
MSELHALLRRQLRRLGLSEAEPPSNEEAWRLLLERLSQSYDDADRERYTTERAFSISSREMKELYDRLQESSQDELARRRDKLAQALALQKAAFDTMTEGVLVVDSDRRIVAFNRAFVHMWRIPEELAAGGDTKQILAAVGVTVANAEQFVARVNYLYAHPRERSVDEVRFLDGRVLDRYSAPVHALDGSVCARLWLFREVTEQRRAEEAERQARQEAEKANRAKTEFLANMSHELRTPLNAIVGFARVLAGPSRDGLDARQLDYLNYVLVAGEHMLALVNDLLDLRRIEESPNALDVAAHDVASLVDAATGMVGSLIKERDHSLSVQVCEAMPRVHCDARALVQVLVNLLSNAAKYTEHGGRISLKIDVAGDRACFDVTDNGVGISSEDQAHLFTYFTQVGAKHQHHMSGSGVGLALTRRLVECMHGTIAVTSRCGVGSSFVVSLPLEQTCP